MRTSSALASGCLALLLSACAQGYESDPGGILPRAPGGSNDGQSGAPGGMAGTGGSAPSDGVYTGEPCTMGDTATCTCAATNTAGIRICRHDSDSPTDGSLSECQSCAPPGTQGPGDVGASGTGAAGTSGSGGRGGSGGSSGSGASGTGGSGGSTAPSTGRCTTGSCTQSCFPVGVLACCSDSGRCGCTWAPGAYCL